MSANAEFLEALVSMGFESGAARVALEATLNDFDESVALLRASHSPRTQVDGAAAAAQLNQLLESALSGNVGVKEETITDILSTIERLNSLQQCNLLPALKVGDRVERGPDWKWGTQDTSAGNPSQGVVCEALDSDGWVAVKWANGTQNKYRYHQGAHDVQLLHSSFPAAIAAAVTVGNHDGIWRDKSKTRFHCSIPGNVEGPICAHDGGILQTSHWSCCGGLRIDDPCKPKACDPEPAEDHFDAVSSAELDVLTRLSVASPNVPFDIVASVCMRLGHDEEATSQVIKCISQLQEMFAPKVTAAMAAEVMLKCADDIDAAAVMLIADCEVSQLSLAVQPTGQECQPSPTVVALPSKVEDKPVCLICMCNPPTHAFIPCGHKQICGSCANDENIILGLKQQCPVCRRDFQFIVQIFEG